jgi:hypothetical protein
MTRSGLVLVIALAACGKDKQAGSGGTVVQSRVLESATFALPEGWTSTYEPDHDAWRFASTDTTIRLERADERYVASPDAYMQHIGSRLGKGRLVTIEFREPVGKTGFAMTLAGFTRENDPKPTRTTLVVRQLGKAWYDCHAEGIDDDALREQVMALCRSVRL